MERSKCLNCGSFYNKGGICPYCENQQQKTLFNFKKKQA